MKDMGIPSASNVEVADTKVDDQPEMKELEHSHQTAQAQRIRTEDQEVEPEFHARTWIALAAFFLLNYVQVFALQGPSSVVSIIVDLSEYITNSPS